VYFTFTNKSFVNCLSYKRFKKQLLFTIKLLKVDEVTSLAEKYVIFKDDDVGKNLPKLKKWVDVVVSNNAKGAIGIIGKYLKNEKLVEYLNSLENDKIEFFCHGYSHSYFPFFVNNKLFNKKRILGVEFDRNQKKHDLALKKYRFMEEKYLNAKTAVFGPPGNKWNDSVIDPLIKHGFKMMFSWRDVKGDLFTIRLSDNFHHSSLNEFIRDYEKNKNDMIYTLQFHHADLSERQFDLIPGVIDFLKKDGRVFVTPSEVFRIFNE